MFDYRNETLDRERLMEHRLASTRSVLDENDLEAMVCCDGSNVRYISDLRGFPAPETFHSMNLVIVNRRGEQYTFSEAFKDYMKTFGTWITKTYDLPAWTRFPAQPDIIAELIAQGLSDAGVTQGRVGVDTISYQVMDALRAKLPRVEFVNIFTAMMRKRMIKSPDEVEMMRLASAANDNGMMAAGAACVVGNTEHDVLAACMGALAKAGAEGYTHYPSCRSGRRTLYYLFPSGRRLQYGDPVIFDCGLFAEGGYISDFCRTFFVGDPSKRMMECYEVVYEAQMNALSIMKPGLRASELNEAINESMIRRGYPGSIYANGHGVGMGMIELPSLNSGDSLAEDYTLQENMVICIEPITSCEEGAVKLEDVVLITKDGCEKLTRTPYLIK